MFAALARYLGLVVQDSPYESSAGLLARPDVAAVIADSLGEAADAARQAVAGAWQDLAGPSPLLTHLADDAARPYSAPHLHGLIARAHASVPLRHREPGRPGTDPVASSARERAQAVQEAVHKFAREAALRNRLSVDVASGHARTEAELARGRDWEEEGYEVTKEWVARDGGRNPASCYWCRHLHGTVIPLDEDFARFLGPAVDLAGHGHLTQPPRPYRGVLPGPKLHPNCGCRLRVTRHGRGEPDEDGLPGVQLPGGSQAGAGSWSPVPPTVPGSLLSAAAVRSLPEARYRPLIAFLRAAVFELGQVLRRLAGGN